MRIGADAKQRAPSQEDGGDAPGGSNFLQTDVLVEVQGGVPPIADPLADGYALQPFADQLSYQMQRSEEISE